MKQKNKLLVILSCMALLLLLCLIGTSCDYDIEGGYKLKGKIDSLIPAGTYSLDKVTVEGVNRYVP